MLNIARKTSEAAALTDADLQKFRAYINTLVVFDDAEWEVLADTLYLRGLNNKERFFQAGTVCNEVAFIVSGSLRFLLVRDGVEFSNYFTFEGEMVSAYGSFLKRTPGLVDIAAMETTRLACLSHSGMHGLLRDERVAHKMERFGRLIAEGLIICYDDRLLSFVAESAEDRYRHLLEKQPELLQRIPQHYVANYLGITPESLSRIRRRLAGPIGR